MRKRWMLRVLALCLCVLVCVPTVLHAEELQVKVGAKELSIRKDLPKEIRNIAVVVCDPQGESKYGPTETMMIASINTRTGAAYMTLLQPALLVEMPMVGQATLSQAYALGGENLVIKTLNELFGLNIREVVAIDLRRFSAVVEAVEGIRMKLTDEEAAAMNLPANEEITLNLEQTLAFMRLPRTDPIQDRQYDVVMQALFQGTRDRNIGKLTDLLKKGLGSIDTKISFIDMVGLGTKVVGGDVREELRLPAVDLLVQVGDQPPYQYTADMEAAKAALHQFLYGEAK